MGKGGSENRIRFFILAPPQQLVSPVLLDGLGRIGAARRCVKGFLEKEIAPPTLLEKFVKSLNSRRVCVVGHKTRNRALSFGGGGEKKTSRGDDRLGSILTLQFGNFWVGLPKGWRCRNECDMSDSWQKKKKTRRPKPTNLSNFG